MTLPALPSQGNTNWYSWAQAVHAQAAEVDSGRLTEAALRAAFGRVTVDDLPASGIVSAHRGSSRDGRPVAPEGAMSAYRLAVTQGAHIIDVDNQTTADGIPVAMHDTTVDATTAATGNVSTYPFHQLPAVSMPEIVGTGWTAEPIPSVEQIFREFGGRVLITVEPKSGLTGVAPLVALIQKYDLERSVYINTNDATVAQAVTNAGCLAHVYGVTTTAGVDSAQAAGADLIEIPYNAAQSLVDYATARIPRVIAAPISSFTQLSAMTPGIQGYVTDALGYLNRPGGAGGRTASTLSPAVSSMKRGAGWRRVLGATGASVVASDGVTLYNGGTFGWHFGDLSGDPTTSGSITFRFVFTTLPTDTFQRVGLRVLCPEETATGVDADTKGYVISLRANGQLNMWSSPLGAYGGGTALGSTPTTAALVAGTEYEIVFSWTATTVQLTRTDTAATTGSVANTDWRGRHIYTVGTLGSGVAYARNLTVA